MCPELRACFPTEGIKKELTFAISTQSQWHGWKSVRTPTMMILLKLVSKCNMISIKIPTGFFFFIGAEWVGWDQLIEKKASRAGMGGEGDC